MFRALAAAAALTFVFTASANDEPNPPPTEGAAGLEGQFVFSQADGKARGCQIILFAEEESGHFRAEIGDDCTAQFEFLGDVDSWDFNEDDIQLIDEANKVVIELTPDTDGLYRGKNPEDGRDYYLERTSG